MGITLIVIGGIWLVGEAVFPSFIPHAIIAVGIAVLLFGRGRS